MRRNVLNYITVEFLADAQKIFGKQYLHADWEHYFYPSTTSLRISARVTNAYGLNGTMGLWMDDGGHWAMLNFMTVPGDNEELFVIIYFTPSNYFDINSQICRRIELSQYGFGIWDLDFNDNLDSIGDMDIDNLRERWEKYFKIFENEIGAEPVPPNTGKGIYDGKWMDGKRNGQGTYIYATGGKYAGEWKDGEEDGFGILTDLDGTIYEGEWKEGKRHGNGTLTLDNGTKYDGEWTNGKMTGQGIQITVNGDTYTGGFRGGLFEGQGSYTTVTGDRYTGEWGEGEINGPGTCTPAGLKLQEGIWKDGEFTTDGLRSMKKIHVPTQEEWRALNKVHRKTPAINLYDEF